MGAKANFFNLSPLDIEGVREPIVFKGLDFSLSMPESVCS